MEKVIHSLDDLYQLLDPKVKAVAEHGQLSVVESNSSMSQGLYSRWRKSTRSPKFSILLSFIQNLGVEMILRDDITVEGAEPNLSEEAKLLQIPSSDEQNLQNQLDVDLVQLTNQFLISATLKDKYLIRDLLIRLISEDL